MPAATRRPKRPLSFWLLAAFFSAFVLFLYGPMLAIFVLSFQGSEGGLTFPMRGVSLHWFAKLRLQQSTSLCLWCGRMCIGSIPHHVSCSIFLLRGLRTCLSCL